MKQALVKPDTPMIEQRNMEFRRMVKRDKEVEDILKAAIDTNLSIEDTVAMVLNSFL